MHFSCQTITLGPTNNEFGYNERPDTASIFLCIKIIDNNVNSFSYNEHPLKMSSFFRIFLLVVRGTQCIVLQLRRRWNVNLSWTLMRMCEIKKLSRLNLLEIFHIIAFYSLFLLFKITNFCMWSDYPFILWGKINSISDLFHSWLCYWLHPPSHIFVVLKLTKWIKCLLNQ